MNASAQKNTTNFLSYKVSEPYRVFDAHVKMYLTYENNTVSVKIDGGKVLLQKIEGSSMTEVSRTEYMDFEPGFVLEQLVEMEGFAYLFYSAWDRPNTTEQLFVRKIDLSTAKFVGENENVVKVKGKVTGGNGNKFIITRSFDKSTILIKYRKQPEVRDDSVNKDNYGLMVLDDKLQTVWEEEVKMPYTESEMTVLEYTIDSEGRVYMLINKKQSQNPDIGIFIISDGEIEASKSEIAVENKSLVSYGFFEGPNNVLLLAGYYNNDNSYGGVDGVFSFELDKNGEVTSKNMYEIPREIISQYTSARSQEKLKKSEGKGNDLSMQSLRLKSLNVADDKSIAIVGEVYFSVTTTTQNGTTTKHYYEDVLVTKISPEGELQWMRKLPKRQVGTKGAGFKYFRNENSHYVLFIDDEKNLVPDVNEEPNSHLPGRGGLLMVTKIDDESGEVTKMAALDLKDAQGYNLGQLGMGRIYDISDNTFGVECYVGKKQDVSIQFTVE